MTASNTMTTAHQTRQDFQYSSTVDGLLKNVYIPALNNVTFHAIPLVTMFGDFGGTIDFVGNKIIKAFKHQGAGGFGGISEGGDWVQGKNQKGFQGHERLKFLNAFFTLTGPAARTVKEGQGAYVDAISSAMDDTLRLAKMQMERIVGGSGTGELCRFAVGAANATLQVGHYLKVVAGASDTTPAANCTASAGGAYTKAQWLCEGLRVNAVIDGNFDSEIPTADFVNDANGARATFEVSMVDYDNATFALKLVTPSSGTSGNVDVAAEMASDTIVLVLENSYGEIEGAGGADSDHCLEPNGLYNLIDDGTTHANIWNLARTAYPRALKSKYTAAASAELDEELMMGYVLDMANIRQAVPEVCVVDPKSRLKYFSNRKEDRRFDMPVLDTSFGFRSLGVTIDQYTMILQSVASLKPGSMMLIKASDFKWAKATDGFVWVTNENGGIVRQREASDNLYASAVNYCNLVCENPHQQMKVDGLAYD